MHLCRNAYNMVLHKYGERLYNGVQEALRSHLRGVAQNVVHAQGTPFLQELVSRWNEHNKSTQMIRDILMVSSSVQGPRG
jgi:cullin 3